MNRIDSFNQQPSPVIHCDHLCSACNAGTGYTEEDIGAVCDVTKETIPVEGALCRVGFTSNEQVQEALQNLV